jgi:hypothetical protein
MYQRNDFIPPTPNTSRNPQIDQQTLYHNEFEFFHYSSNDDKFFLVNCKKMIFQQESTFLDEQNYDHKFFFQCSNNPAANYYVMCKLFPHSSIINVLNKQICGIDIDINILKQNESLHINQKFNLEQELKQILSSHFTKQSKHSDIPEKDSHGMTIQSADDRNDHGIRYSYSHEADLNNFPQRHIPEEISPRYANSHHESTAVSAQTISTIDVGPNYNDNNSLSSSNYIIHQDVTGDYSQTIHLQQQVVPNNFLQHPREKTSDYDRNINSFHGHGNIGNNVTITTQAASMTNMSQNYNDNDNDNDNVLTRDDYITHREDGGYTNATNTQQNVYQMHHF